MGATEAADSTGPAAWGETLRMMPLLPVLMVSVSAHMMLFGMLTPVMAIYAKNFGAPEWQIGLMVTVFAAGRLVADIPAGHAAPKFGLKFLLVIGMFLCSAGALIGATAGSYAILLGGRTLQGIGSGLFMTSAMFYCANQSDRRSRGKVMSMFQGATLVGGAFGPSVGGLAADAFGINGPFYAAVAIGLIAGGLPLLLLKDERPAERVPLHIVPAGKTTSLLLILPFVAALMVNFGLFLTRTAGQWQMIPLMAYERFEIGPEQMGFAISLSAIATLTVLPISAYLVDWAPRPLVIVVSLIATAAALFSLVFAPSVEVLYISMAAMGISTGIAGPTLAAYAVDVAPHDRQGPAMGVLRFAGDLGYLVGPISIGTLVDLTHIGHQGGITVNAAMLAFLGAIFALFATSTRTRLVSTKTRKPTMIERIWDSYLSEEDKAVFAASGFGALAEWGKRPALLIIDVNYAFCDEEPAPILESIKKWRTSCGEYAWKAMPVLQKLISSCHGKGIPVIYTTGSQRPDRWDAGSWSWKSSGRKSEVAAAPPPDTNGIDGNDIVAAIEPGARDIVIRKQKPSGFAGTPLASYLQLLGCDSVIVTGTTTSGCVRATVLDAFSLNFRVTVVEDGCFDRAQANHAINLCDMHAKYANVMHSDEVIDYLNGLSQGMFDLPSGAGMERAAAE
jgi:MFS family permease/nicotinamidase-related amidase